MNSELLSFEEVRCELPVLNDKFFSKDNSIPTSTYNITLSNNGTAVSNDVFVVTLYDSKCMVCTNSSATEGNGTKCSLKVYGFL